MGGQHGKTPRARAEGRAREKLAAGGQRTTVGQHVRGRHAGRRAQGGCKTGEERPAVVGGCEMKGRGGARRARKGQRRRRGTAHRAPRPGTGASSEECGVLTVGSESRPPSPGKSSPARLVVQTAKQPRCPPSGSQAARLTSANGYGGRKRGCGQGSRILRPRQLTRRGQVVCRPLHTPSPRAAAPGRGECGRARWARTAGRDTARR